MIIDSKHIAALLLQIEKVDQPTVEIGKANLRSILSEFLILKQQLNFDTEKKVDFIIKTATYNAMRHAADIMRSQKSDWEEKADPNEIIEVIATSFEESCKIFDVIRGTA